MAHPASARLSPAMRERYGLDHNPWPARILAMVVIAAYAAVVVYVTVQMSTDNVESRILTWEQPLPDRVDVTFDVTKPEGLPVACALRAQDSDRVDLGYAEVRLSTGAGYVQQTYRMRVIGPVALVEVLGCGEAGEPLRVPAPAFPPGVVAPVQPWTDS